MGTFKIKVKVCGTKRCEILDSWVDTASSYSAIAPDVAERIGALIVEENFPFETAKGRVYGKVGVAKINVEGKEMWLPVAIVEDTPPTVGAVTLESLGFKVDPIKQKLEPVKGLPRL